MTMPQTLGIRLLVLVCFGALGVPCVIGQSCNKGPCYRFFEVATQSKCTDDCQCDGSRRCSASGFCRGTARRPGVCSNAPGFCTDTCYTTNEAGNTLGANKCADACDCDGGRTCSSAGFCQGTARPTGAKCGEPTTSCASACYRADERKAQSKCKTDCDCDGKRTCSGAGFCQGVARAAGVCSNTPAYCADQCFIVDETKSPLGANKCGDSCDCDGSRTCSGAGFCQGTARPPGSCGTGLPPVVPPPLVPCQGVTVLARGRREVDLRFLDGIVEITNRNSVPLQLKEVTVVLRGTFGGNPLRTVADCPGSRVQPNSNLRCRWRVRTPMFGLGALNTAWTGVVGTAILVPEARCESAPTALRAPSPTSLAEGAAAVADSRERPR